MKYQAAYSLLFISGKSSPTQADVEKFMKDSGISCDKKGNQSTR
jgi:ribosomal protein L12E/L44/L45/RPP1/RPP2